MLCLFLYLLTCTTLLTCGAQEYYVTPTPPPNPNCPSDKPCQTLDYYANNASGLINERDNVSLLFMSGYHTSDTIFEIKNVDTFTVAGLDLNFDPEIPSTMIGFTRMLISNGIVFTLKNIAISSTWLNVSNFQSMINHKAVCDNSLVTLVATQVDSVLLTNSRLQQCVWSLYWGYINEIVTIGVSTEADQKIPIVEMSNTNVSSESVINIGLARNSSTSVHLNIAFCSFVNTNGLIITAHTVGQPLPESDLVIRMDHCSMTDDVFGTIINAIETHNVHVHISDSYFTAFANDSKTITLIANVSTLNATVQDSNFLGGLGITAPVLGNSTFLLTVHACNFTKASLDSIRISTKGGIINVLIEDCRFTDGFNQDSTFDSTQDRVILVHALKSWDTPQIVLRNSVFFNNSFVTGIIHILGAIHMTIDNCTIKDNSAIVSGGLLAFYSNITLMGNTIFENNAGSTGGAMYLFESPLLFTENLNLVFLDNTAKSTGGAIFVAERGSPTFGDEIVRSFTNPSPNCFYQLEIDGITTQASVTFSNNTALTGGNNIYGAGLKDNCTVTPNRLTSSYTIQDSLFDFQPRSQSSVSSSPRRVCACKNGKPKCADIDYIFIDRSVTPGETTSIELILVGFDFGATTGGVFATELPTGTDDKTTVTLGTGEDIQLLDSNNQCETITYTISGDINSTTTFILTSSRLNAETILLVRDLQFKETMINESVHTFDEIGVISTSLLYTPIFINVQLLPCSIGLELDNENQTCRCSSELLDDNLATECTIQNGKTLISRNIGQRTWFSQIHNDSNHGLVLQYGVSCLFAYCNSTVLDIDPSNPDSQCAHNHSGVLCGGCPEGLSLALGSLRCLECPDNSNVSLILVFLLLGIVLVLFIWILDLTISRGTINGLLFYVNIVSINREIFFVEHTGLGDTLENCLKAAQWFVDWCNLDFGIESCFIFELTAMGKIWLQFFFPLYVWSLAGLIIVACKYSPRLTKLFGYHSVSVLLTLFLIAYKTLVQITIASFTYANIRYLDSDLPVRTVWLIDGNVNYGETYHVLLCLVSGVMAIFLFMFTIWLLLVKWAKKLPWHHKINPILDSYTGPLKKNHEYWIGLSLLTRVGFALGTIIDQRTIILPILITVLFILGVVVSHVYKMIYLSLLEIAFLMNLIILSAIFVAQTDKYMLAISISVSVFISFLIFFGICVYHGIEFVKRVRPKVSKYLRDQRETKRKIKEAESKQVVDKTPTVTLVDLSSSDATEMSNNLRQKMRVVADYSNYREDLLDSTDL